MSACGSGDSSSTVGALSEREPDRVFEAKITSTGILGGPVLWRVKRGQVVRISLQSDVDDTLHVHGVDLEKSIAAEKTSSITLEVFVAGSYELELHDLQTSIGTLQVR